MEQKLLNFIDFCLGLANGEGLSETNPIVLDANASEAETHEVVVSFTEPTELVLPLNVVWIVADPDSADYKKIFKRTSKDANPPNANTWAPLSLYSEVFEPAQYYADEDKPEPVIIAASGGQLSGPVYARILEQGVSYDANELVPKDYVDGSTLGARQFTISIFNNMNPRILYNDKRIRDLEVQDDTFTNTITELGGRVSAVEDAVGAGTVSTTYKPGSALDVWVIHHNFYSENVLVQVFDTDGFQVLPKDIHIASENIVVVLFDLPQDGKATVIKA